MYILFENGEWQNLLLKSSSPSSGRSALVIYNQLSSNIILQLLATECGGRHIYALPPPLTFDHLLPHRNLIAQEIAKKTQNFELVVQGELFTKSTSFTYNLYSRHSIGPHTCQSMRMLFSKAFFPHPFLGMEESSLFIGKTEWRFVFDMHIF